VASSEYAEGLPPNKTVLGAKNVKLLPLKRFKEIQQRFGNDVAGSRNLPIAMGQIQAKPKKKELSRAKEGCGRCVAFLLLVGVPSAMPLKLRAITSEGQVSIIELWTEVRSPIAQTRHSRIYDCHFLH
jgi:hypothetical protein